MSAVLTFLSSFLLGFAAIVLGSEMLGRTLLTLGAFYAHMAR